jgi:cytochrome c biogenesis protein CcmG, thiol:disulfide interchange protein DsbE
MAIDHPPPDPTDDRPDATVCLSRRALLRTTCALLVTTACGMRAPLVRANDLTVGQAAPPLVLQTLDGKNISTHDLHGKVVIVTFWATWCSPCREELPLLSDYAEHHANQGLQVLGFTLDGVDDLAKVRSVAAALRFPVGLLGNPWAGGYGRIWRVPVSFVIDRAGRLAYNGWEDENPVWTKERLTKVVDPLLMQSS